MYSDSDLDAGVTAGLLPAGDVAAFRAWVVAGRSTPAAPRYADPQHPDPLHADEEQFRLVTGFNDIFVSIAAVLLLGAVAWIGGSVHLALGGAAVAAVAWGLAEYFTARRRMALPSILLLLAFVGGIFFAFVPLMGPSLWETSDTNGALLVALAAAVAALGAYAHWRRFHVPITVAAGVSALVGLVLALVLAAFPTIGDHMLPIMFVAGVAVFLFAMRWDLSDPQRTTRRSDVAFWLHLTAAPLIVHPVFGMLGLLNGEANALEALAVLGLYVVLGVVALAIDRRALMVSALSYVLYALSILIRTFGALDLSFALTALVIGSALLMLSALWPHARRIVLARLPERLRDRLPPVSRPATVSPRPA